MRTIRRKAVAWATRHTPGDRDKWFRRASVGLLLSGLLTCAFLPTSANIAAEEGEPSEAQANRRPKNKFRDFSEVTEGAKRYDGLFKLYEVDDHLYAEIRPNQFNQMYLAPIAIARGLASAGTPLNFGDEWILSFRRTGDRIQLIRKNIHYEAPKGTPLAKAVEQNYTDSILMALPIVSINPMTQGALIDFSSIFLSDFAGLGLGPMDRSRSSWHKIKTFENNVELEVEATFGAGRVAGRSGLDDGVVDSRGVTLVIHYSLAKRPDPGYTPRFADQRVGHFISATKDFGSSDPDTTFVRRINRWRLEKANPQAKLSPPKKQIVWWVENTVPHEYRPYVEEGILEWNKAFERIGFRNAIGVRWQNDQDEFDPEDINYCTFRWITTPSTYAMSGLRADPITGEMIDGDVIFDASWIRAWKREYAFLVGAPVSESDGRTVIDVAEIISPMMAAKFGFGLPTTPQHRQHALHQHAHDHGLETCPELIPSDQSPLSRLLSQRLTGSQFTACQFAAGRRHEYTLAAMALAARAQQEASDDDQEEEEEEEEADEEDEEEDEDEDKNEEDEEAKAEAKDKEAKGEDAGTNDAQKKKDDQPAKEEDKDADDAKDKDKEGDEDKDKKSKDHEIKLPEELIGQAIKEVVMHEVGHSLGLRHNFKASAMLSLDQINDPKITQEKGMVGSVMDYNPLNIARKGEKQGDYATTTIGPYDYWAIEYAYKPIRGNEAEELKKIAARSPEKELVYATDEDLYMSNDPLVNTYDLGDDTLRYAKERVALSQELLKGLEESIVRDGESWSRLRQAFSVLLSQYGNSAYMATAYVGGQYFSRDFKGGENSRDPIVPVEGEKQREALKFVADQILTDQPFNFSPELLRRLTTEHWYHWASDSMLAGSTDYDVYDRVLRIQQIVLSHCLSADVLHRLQNQQLMVEKDSKPLGIAEVFRTLTDAIWSELPNGKMPDKLEVTLIRRNLQRDHLRRLCQIVVSGSGNAYANLYGYAVFLGGGSAYPADARSLARMHLVELKERLEKLLEGSDVTMDDSARAHFQESRDLIGKVLSAEIESSVN
jgi:hypothetical protein